jgi:hypothetical protein
MKTPILGAAYEAASLNAAADRCVNLYYEMIPHGGRDAGFLAKVPGLRKIAELGDGPIRGMHQFGPEAFVVSGDTLYKIGQTLGVSTIGVLASSAHQVSMADNGLQLFIACGANAFIYTKSTGILEEIADVDFPGASSVVHVDGYFCFCEPLTQRLWWTAIYDGSSIDALDYASAEGHPDKTVAVKAVGREVWLLGTNSTEVFYNTGSTDQAFARMQGAFVAIGCLSAYSVAHLDNSLFWLGRSPEGAGVVFKSEGYGAKRVSTHAIEHAINQTSAPSQATGFTYQQRGHSFYVLNLNEKTFVYDVSTNLWHERATLTNGELGRYRVNHMAQVGGYILVGDYQTGGVYVLDQECYTDDGGPLPWVRAWRAIPPGQNDGSVKRFSGLDVFIEPGIGSAVMSLRWSDDGGKTWGNMHEREVGRVGEYKHRARWHRLGASRDRVFELSGSDPAKTIITGADLT